MNISLETITGCINGDRRAQHDLYKESYVFLLSICMRYSPSRDDADDLLNIGFLKILSNIGKYRPEIPFGIWIRKVMINVIIDEFRTNKKYKANIVYIDEYNENVSMEDILEDLKKIEAEQIYKLIAQLPTVSQQVFNLYVIDDYSHKEIAEMLKIAVGTSKWHLNFSRQKLKEMINRLSPNIRTNSI